MIQRQTWTVTGKLGCKMEKIDIRGEIRFISCKEDFVHLVEEHMGTDAADWLKKFIREGIEEVFSDINDSFEKQMDDALEQIKTEINTAKKDYLSKLL